MTEKVDCLVCEGSGKIGQYLPDGRSPRQKVNCPTCSGKGKIEKSSQTVKEEKTRATRERREMRRRENKNK